MVAAGATTSSWLEDEELGANASDLFSLRKPQDARAGCSSGLKSLLKGVLGGIASFCCLPRTRVLVSISVTKFVESLRKEGAPSSSSVAGEGRGDGDIIDTVATYIEEKIAENPRRLPEDDNVSKVKPPPGVSIPSQQPNFSNRRVGFTFKAERINSRYAMVGFVAVLLIEAATGRGVLEILGFNIGNGLDLWF